MEKRDSKLWFMHLARSIDDPDIIALIKKFRHTGYYVFFGLLEVMRQEFDVNKPGVFLWDKDFICKRLTINWKRLEPILKEINKRKRMEITITGSEIHFNCPRLTELMGGYIARVLAGTQDTYDKQKKRKGKDGQVDGQLADNTGKDRPILATPKGKGNGKGKDDKGEPPVPSKGPKEQMALDLAKTLIIQCPAERLEWAKDEFVSAIVSGIVPKEISDTIQENPGRKAKEIINLIRVAGWSSNAEACERCSGKKNITSSINPAWTVPCPVCSGGDPKHNYKKKTVKAPA